MLLIISPAKSLDFSQKVDLKEKSEPIFINEAQVLVEQLRKYKPEGLSLLMGISAKLAELNYEQRIYYWPKGTSNFWMDCKSILG